MKLEVVVDVSVEMILMQQLLLWLLLFFEAWWWEVLLERGSHCAFSRLALITVTLNRPFEEQFYFSTKFLIAALNLHVTTHFHCFDILHFKQITFLRILVIFKMKNRFSFSARYSLTLAVFFTTTLTSHETIPLMNFL